MPRKTKSTTDAVQIIDRLIYKGKPARRRALEELRARDEVGRRIYELRTKANLTQAQLAERIGTTASVICCLEDADYKGHSLALLRRIAVALNQRVEISIVTLRKSA